MTTGVIDAYAFDHALTQQAISNELTLRSIAACASPPRRL